MKRVLALILGICLAAANGAASAQAEEWSNKRPGETEVYDMKFHPNDGEAVIYLAGGCFWGMEKLMSVIPGVADAASGYANGTTANPTYREVCTGMTGHRETVRVVYRPDTVSLQAILFVYFGSIDPTVKNRQGNDVGEQYQTGIYYVNPEDEAVIQGVVDVEKARQKPFFVEVAPLTAFYEAEAEHQDYLDVHPGGYCHIGPRAFERAKNLVVDPKDYQKPDDATLRQTLNDTQYAVTQQSATEAPYQNEFWDANADGLYVDITTGEPLFSSADKYPSSCGWPAFGKGLDENALYETEDDSHGMRRTEVRSRVGNAHLGHVFAGDFESPTGVRYCINSASLRFVPYDQMAAEGYGQYMRFVK